MRDMLRSRFRTFLNRMMTATRVLPAAGFGRTADPPTDSIQRDDLVEELPPGGELHEQQHVEVPSRAVGKRPRN